MAWSGFRNRKDGPQQGTLFDVRQVPSQPVDSPGMQKRGRRAEMLAAMPETHVYPTTPQHGEVAQKIEFRAEDRINRRENDPRPSPQMGDLNPTRIKNRATDRAGSGRRAEIARDLADKTTVSPDSLRGLKKISEGQERQGQVGGFSAGRYPNFRPGVAARYTEIAGGPAIEAPSRMNLGTLTHEIGHHESRYHYRNTSTDAPRVMTPHGLDIDPAEEGRADAFSLEHAPEHRTYTYASNAMGTEYQPKFAGIQSPYRREREAMGQPLREWEGGEAPSPNVGRQFEQLASFDIEPAFAPESEADVQAYTRDGGREVVGWSPQPPRFGDREAIFKHDYRLNVPEGEPEWMGEPNPQFRAANYATMFADDIVPEQHRDDWLDQQTLGSRDNPAVKQTWRR